MVLLAGVFLRNLEFDGFVRFFETAEKRRNGFPRLEIDWAVFDLNDDVVFELAVERMEIVVGGLGAIVFGLGGVWRPSSLRWHAPVAAIGTLAFWIMAAEAE